MSLASANKTIIKRNLNVYLVKFNVNKDASIPQIAVKISIPYAKIMILLILVNQMAASLLVNLLMEYVYVFKTHTLILNLLSVNVNHMLSK